MEVESSPKIRNFWWHLFKNILPSKENLFRCRCSPSPLCSVCHQAPESTEHILVGCPWTRAVWFGSGLHSVINPDLFPSGRKWSSQIVDRSASLGEAVDVIGRIAFVAWNIWKGRNDCVFNHAQVDPKTTLIAAGMAAHEFLFLSSVSNAVFDHQDPPS